MVRDYLYFGLVRVATYTNTNQRPFLYICYIMDGGVFLFSKLVIRYVSEEKEERNFRFFVHWLFILTELLLFLCFNQLNPSGAAGAMTAMQDALCLANWINVLPENTIEATDNIFKEYYKERYSVVMEANRSSQFFASRSEKVIISADI